MTGKGLQLGQEAAMVDPFKCINPLQGRFDAGLRLLFSGLGRKKLVRH